MMNYLRACLLASLYVSFAPHSLADGHADDPKDFLKDLHGQTVLVDFWASWCGPCRRSFPWMNRILDKYGDRSFTIVAVNVDKLQRDAEEFLAQTPARFDIVYDPDGNIARAFDVQAMPSSYLLNTEGEIVEVHRGFLSEKTDSYELSIRNQLIHSTNSSGGN